MRNKKAKQLRKIIFGDISQKVRKYIKTEKGQIMEIYLRKRYRGLKVLYKKNFIVKRRFDYGNV